MTAVNRAPPKAPVAQAAKEKETAAAVPEGGAIVETEEGGAIGEGCTEGGVAVSEGDMIGGSETEEGGAIGEVWTDGGVTVVAGEITGVSVVGESETEEGDVIAKACDAIGLGANVEAVTNIIVPVTECGNAPELFVAPASSANELFEVSLPDCAGVESSQLILYDDLMRQLGLEADASGVFGAMPPPTAGGPLQQTSYLPTLEQTAANLQVGQIEIKNAGIDLLSIIAI